MYPRLKGKLRTSSVRKSLFWFKKDAYFWNYEKGSVVRRARDLANVLTGAGCEIREITMRDLGKIIWQDTKQILALPGPDKKVPRAF